MHRGANAAAASLVQKQQLNAISPLSLVSMSSPDQPSTSFSLSAGPNTQTSDGFYRLSQQPSIGDSNTSDASVGSMVLGDDAKSLMKSQKQSHPRIVKGKPSSELSSSENLYLVNVKRAVCVIARTLSRKMSLKQIVI